MIVIRPEIIFTFEDKAYDKQIKCQFNYPYNEILDKCFLTDTVSSIGSIKKVENTLLEIEEVIRGERNNHVIIGYDQDSVIHCFKDKCKIVDSGPDEIHSVPPNEIYGPNWNKRYPDKEWIDTQDLIELLKTWKSILEKYENYVCVPSSDEKQDYIIE